MPLRRRVWPRMPRFEEWRARGHGDDLWAYAMWMGERARTLIVMAVALWVVSVVLIAMGVVS